MAISICSAISQSQLPGWMISPRAAVRLRSSMCGTSAMWMASRKVSRSPHGVVRSLGSTRESRIETSSCWSRRLRRYVVAVRRCDWRANHNTSLRLRTTSCPPGSNSLVRQGQTQKPGATGKSALPSRQTSPAGPVRSEKAHEQTSRDEVHYLVRRAPGARPRCHKGTAKLLRRRH